MLEAVKILANVKSGDAVKLLLLANGHCLTGEQGCGLKRRQWTWTCVLLS